MDELLGRYRLSSRIGIGGMAEVFLARATGAGNFARTVVVKRMIPQLAEDPHAVQMFLDEAQLGARLHHPHIVPVLDLGEIDGAYFMVLEHVDGVDLGTLEMRVRARQTTLHEQDAAWIVARAAEGLHAAHEARDPETGQALRVVHRDVSPSNILISRTGDVKVADFGVARSAAQAARTSTGAMKGKLPYMSPEQLSGDELDARSDIYGLGVVLWQLLAGRRLHEGRNELGIIKSVLQDPAPPPSEHNPSVDPELEAIVLSMLAKRPQDRPSSAREAARDIDRWLVARGHEGRLALEQSLSALPGILDTSPGTSATIHDDNTAARTPSNPGSRAGTLLYRPSKTPSGQRAAVAAAEPAPARTPTSSLWDRVSERCIIQSPDSQTRTVNGEAIVITPHDKTLHTLNASATFIWERADGTRTLSQIADALLAHFDVEPELARAEVVAFVREAVEKGFILFSAGH